ncbi:YjbH domain-containing protein [Gammaproteobacteria bacterium]|nr:YjbH domain-containing protein [Gammaproteobacteria bacterium]
MFVLSLRADYSYNYEGLGSSYNSFGQVGLIQTPTADSKKEGTVSFIFNKNDIWKFGTLSVSPFDWLEASYFYYRPSDLRWEGNNVAGHYLDKGFNVKFKYKPKNNNLPHLAIGLDDFAGTGFFTREYIVATQELRDIKISLGMGWGKFVGNNNFENPLSFLSDSLNIRPSRSSNFDNGGTPSYDKWFRGNAAMFGGIEYFFPKVKGLSMKVEYDPYNYFNFSAPNRNDAIYDLRKKDSDINIGFSYPVREFLTIDASYIKGNTFNLSFTIGATFNGKLRSKPKFKPTIKTRQNNEKSEIIFYEDLLDNLNKNNLLLQTASLSKDRLDISISTSQHINAIRSSSYAGSIASKISRDHNINLSQINISHINAGVELNNITYIANHLDSSKYTPLEIIERYTKIDSGNKDSYKKHEFQPSVKFPAVFSSFSPSLVSNIGNPEKFYFWGLDLQNTAEIQFSRSLLLSSEINYSLYNNFQDTISGPASNMEHVRTDKVQYLKNANLYIKRLQLDYIWSPRKDLFAKVSAGMFETMFGGFGGQVLYKPFNSNLNISFEGFYVRQREYDQAFKFRRYKTTTAHFNLSYLLPMGIESNISYGRYLAKDDGFTFDLSRRTKSGFKAGIFFTRTNVSAELFGEGSFDKGFYFQIPMDLFSKDYKGGYSNFKLTPLTRDGGAKLEFDKDLRGLIYNSSLNQLRQQWR